MDKLVLLGIILTVASVFLFLADILMIATGYQNYTPRKSGVRMAISAVIFTLGIMALSYQ